MQPTRRVVLILAIQIFDLAAMSLAFLGSLALSGNLADWPTFNESFLTQTVSLGTLILFALSVVAWHYIFKRFRLYDSHRLAKLRSQLFEIAVACLVATGATLALGVVLGVEHAGPMFGLELFLTGVLLLIASRVILRATLSRVRIRGRNLRHTVIVGTNDRAIKLKRYFESHPQLGYVVSGFVADEHEHHSECQPVVSDYAGFVNYLRSHVIDEVFLYAPLNTVYEHLKHIVAACEEQGIIIRLRSDVFDLSIGRFRIENAIDGDFPTITMYTGRQHGWPVAVKRIVDVAVAFGATVLCLPILIAAAIAIKLDSPGPILFVQERIGLNKRRFNLYKFRTMVVDAEARQESLAGNNEADGPVFKIKNDPRVTRVGRLLRRLSIDELPQLLNVLLGDMSLVGPRPLPVRDYEKFSSDWTRRRFSVRPGITCLWQVSGRSNIAFDRWMELDMQYIDQWSLLLDLKILLKTLPAVVRADGAY